MFRGAPCAASSLATFNTHLLVYDNVAGIESTCFKRYFLLWFNISHFVDTEEQFREPGSNLTADFIILTDLL